MLDIKFVRTNPDAVKDVYKRQVINSYAQVSHNRNHRNFLKGERAPMTVFSAESFDVAVIGAGHAGIEAVSYTHLNGRKVLARRRAKGRAKLSA